MKKSKLIILISSIVGGTILLFVGVFLLLAFVFPYNLAREAYDLGFNTYALKLYDRAYNKDADNVDALYMALNLSIKLERNEKTETYFEAFCADANYTKYINNIDKENYKKNTNVLIKSTLLSEDNYLKNRYVAALIAQDKLDKAINFCQNSLKAAPTTFDMGNYYYANFAIKKLTEQDLTFLSDDGVYSDILQYFQALSTNFDQSYKLNNFPERVCAGNRIITVGNNLLYFDAVFSTHFLSADQKTEIKNTIEQTKTSVNLLLME